MRHPFSPFTSLALLGCLFLFIQCTTEPSDKAKQEPSSNVGNDPIRIVSLKGAFSEFIAEAGMGDQLVGTDITSNYPESVNDKPKLGHNRNVSVEGALGLDPTLIIADPTEMKPSAIEQFKATGIELVLIKQDYSVDGTYALLTELGKALGAEETATKLNEQIKADLAGITPLKEQPTVLFIYARGAGTIMVAGENTQIESMIELAGARNAVTGFESFKPLSSEALIKFNPDVILMFESGMSSLQGKAGVLDLPGMRETTAGKNEHIITMEGQYLAGFGPRLGQAVTDLNRQLFELKNTP